MKIGVFTSSRADFGVLKNIILKLNNDKEIDLTLYISGAHLSDKYGQTINEVKKLDINKSYNISYLLDSSNEVGISKGLGTGIISFSQIIEFDKPDLMMILGDRHELLIPASICVTNKIPLVHIAGGQITEGVIDEQIRHSITKIAHIHLVSAEDFAYNVSQMGEEDWRISIVGAAGLENIDKVEKLSIKEIFNEIQVDLSNKTILCTYHPVTLEENISTESQISNLIEALNKFKEYQVVFTAPGSETESNIITEKIKRYTELNENVFFFKNLGARLYINVMRNSEVVLGNSSSGIIEAPSLNVPTVNIGDRQKNRISANSVINCGYTIKDIVSSLNKALSKNKNKIYNPYKPYDDFNVSDRVFSVIKNIKINEDLFRKKLDFNINEDDWNTLIGGKL